MESTTESERWHRLLTTRYVCEVCLTRFFVRYRRCPACHSFGHIRPLEPALRRAAQDNKDLRRMMAQGPRKGAEGDVAI